MRADLYASTVDPAKYLGTRCCDGCGFSSCAEWLEKLRKGQAKVLDCKFLDPNKVYPLEIVLSLEEILPPVEIPQHPVEGLKGIYELNDPGPDDPVLVTGSAAITQEVLLAVLSTTSAPFHLLFVDTRGHTIDMAMIYETFTPEQVSRALIESRLEEKVRRREIILPGLARSLKEPIEAITKWKVTVGPVCAGELPLFMADHWTRPGGKVKSS